ncbi:uncharacterized protein LOC129235466 [Anastrepha obliqua]|uniref:uncharacterized protein LOC129235466 n=1 Tax=Anastrepha obliqua TaxID=95512 RepID=UPI002409BC2A|nr:uncharacterized protein LOC129235466 [Anastrepha obliqua]
MVGSFMQGVLLMGIIYWYTRGMLSLINDYYRTEIQRKMQINEPLNESSDFISVDQIVEHRLGMSEEQQEQTIERTPPPMMELKDPGGDERLERKSKDRVRNLLAREGVCLREKRLEELHRIVKRPKNICLISENMLAAAK